MFVFKIGEGLSKGGILFGELRHVAREKELCVKYGFHVMINKGQIQTVIISKETQFIA